METAKSRLSLLVLAGVLVTTMASAQDTYMSLGYGGVACKAWLARTAIENRAYEAWVWGFISSYNAYVFKGPNVVDGTDNDGLRNWIESYCKQNPQESLDSATQSLIIEHKKKNSN